MPEISRSRLTGFLAAALVIASGLGWWLLRDVSTEHGTNILGFYRERWFIFNLGLSYAAVWCLWIVRSGFPRKRLAEIVGIHIGAVAALVVLETTALLGWVDYSRSVWGNEFDPVAGDWTPWTSTRADAARLDPRLRRMTAANLDLEGEARPDLARRLELDVAPVRFHFRTDAFGFRNETGKPTPQIYCIGDSQLVGPLLAREDLVSERLERLLGVSVLNLGEPGYALQEELIRLERTNLPLRGKLVVQFISGQTDLFDSREWREWRERGASSNWPASGPTKLLLRLLHHPRAASAPAPFGFFQGRDGEIEVFFFPELQTEADVIDEMPALEDALRQGRSRIEGAGGRYALVLVPARLAALEVAIRWPDGSPFADWRQSDRLFAATIAEFAAGEGIPFQDLTPALHELARSGELPFPPLDTHMTARGHEVAASHLAPWLSGLLSQIPEAP